MPRATVLMTVYNAAPFLQECIDSVLNQTIIDFEFWIIDDGSTDGSKALLSKQTDSRVKKYFNETNLGIAFSLNQYLHKIQTEYIFRMDADDVCLPTRLQNQIIFMDANPSIGISGCAMQYFGHKNYIWYPALKHHDIVARLLFNCAIPNPSLVIRKSLVVKYQLYYSTAFIKPPMEDYALLIDGIQTFEFGNLGEVLVKHREHNKNQSTQYLSLKESEMIRIYKRLFDSLGIRTSTNELLLHYQLSYNVPDFEKFSIDDFLHWCNYLQSNFTNLEGLKKVIRLYLIKLLKHLIMKPLAIVKLLYYLLRI